MELDTRFGLLEGGLFDELDKLGALDHHVEGVDDIQQAVTQPPVGPTRAYARGRHIHKLQNNRNAHCDWGVIYTTGPPLLVLKPVQQ